MISDAVAAKVRQLRERYEQQGFEIVERPGPEAFPFDTGYVGHSRPALLARRGDEHVVFDIREEIRGGGQRLVDRSREIRKHPGWRFYLVTCDDVIPFDAPGVQGDPPEWPRLEELAEEARRLAESGSRAVVLLALWRVLEGMLRRVAVDHALPTDRLPSALLVPMLYDRGYVPFEAYEPLTDALDVHRRIVHGYEATEAELGRAVDALLGALPAIIAENLEHAS